jgi:hypothetical protein
MGLGGASVASAQDINVTTGTSVDSAAGIKVTSGTTTRTEHGKYYYCSRYKSFRHCGHEEEETSFTTDPGVVSIENC